MKKTLPVELTLSISAMIIAISSIVISIWEGITMRNHYHLSVQPRLDYFFDMEGFPDDDETNFSTAVYKIKNNGLGPAVITDIEYFIDEKKINTGFDENKDTLFDESFNFDNIAGHAYSTFLIGQTIPMNETLTIYEYAFITKEAFERQSMEFHDRLSFIIKYESLYGEQFEVSHNMDIVTR
tara:strand:+ start:30 stop:575 length:546 start_codon:yes stop_codon:yes gene_type:complete